MTRGGEPAGSVREQREMARAAHEVAPVVAQDGSPRKSRKGATVTPGIAAGASGLVGTAAVKASSEAAFARRRGTSRELKHILVYQKAAFNSPVWFNVGFEKKPQCSACFINSVQDTMDSILDAGEDRGHALQVRLGHGLNLSPIRSSKELLAGGGTASGPVSFMKGFDALRASIKSGGKTRRAAKMVILNVDHPDIVEFINCKVEEEKKAWALIDAGYDGSFNGPATRRLLPEREQLACASPTSS
jgi:ribonucleotide reductase alpha subunit